MTPKLYRIVPGHELTADQLTAIWEEAPHVSSKWAHTVSWYFSADGRTFLNVWRDL